MTRNGGLLGQESPDGRYLYFMKRSPAPRFRRDRGPLANASGGGEETQVLETVYNRAFEVRAEGIYYISWSSEDGHRACSSMLSGGKRRGAGKFRRPHRHGSGSPPDGKSFLFTRQDTASADLMLVDNFR